jgi:hypothetical protein
MLVLFNAWTSAIAYEADVHFGLTKWLALKADFQSWQAHAIAIGDYRVDSGLMSTLSIALDYACVQPDPDIARRIQRRHFPSATAVPALPAERSVDAGAEAATKALADIVADSNGNEAQFLGLFGAALHPVQDAWAHAGTPAIPHPQAGLTCSATLASSPPMRIQKNPHAADQTATSEASTLAMAEATYQALQAFPRINGQVRTPVPWTQLSGEVRKFAAMRTKAAKRAWFAARGIETIGFLNDTTLPDGLEPIVERFPGRELPELRQATSSQHDAPLDAKAFFDVLFARWLGAEPIEKVLADTGLWQAKAKGRNSGSSPYAQLAARMKLWKLRDHGAAAELAHAPLPLTARQLAEVSRLASRPSAYVFATLDQAVFPLVATGPYPSPILPYVIRQLPGTGNTPKRIIAMMRLTHAPRDTVGWIAERTGHGWALADVVAVVDQ